MHHLQQLGSTADLTVDQQTRAARQTLLLGLAEIKESQAQRTAVVTDPNQQAAPSAVLDLGPIHGGRDERMITRAQTRKRHDAGAILIPPRQTKQHVLDGLDGNSGQFRR